MSRFNPDSADWKAALDRIEHLLQLACEKLEDPGLSHDDTQALRGEIRAYRNLAGLKDETDAASLKLKAPAYK